MTEQDYTREAEAHLRRWIEAQRQQRVVSDILETAVRDGEIGGDVDAGLSSGNEGESDHADAKQAALEYAKSRNANTRVRSYPQENASQREGVQAALRWLQRKKKSAIRK
jgi:hypothetical protein